MSIRSFARATGAALCLLALLPAVAAAHRPPGPDVAVEWNQATLDLLATPGVQPSNVHPTRTIALVGIAVDDAIDAVDLFGAASTEAAAAAAGHGVLTGLYPARREPLDARLAADLAALPAGLPRAVGQAIGAFVAARTIAGASDDGSAATPPVLAPGTAPGEWRPVPPAFAPAPYTHYPSVRPFVLRSPSQFRLGPPPALTSAQYAAALAQVRSLGAVDSQTRTVAQTDTARFWSAGAQIYWSAAAARLATDRKLPLPRAAHLLRLMNVALADATIATYDSKYTYKRWRPVTAIREGGDAAWLPLLSSGDPSYPGGHSVLSGAGAEVLKRFFGHDIGVTITSGSAVRTYAHASDAAAEAGVSRVLGGVHFAFDSEGRRMGEAVGRYVARRMSERGASAGGGVGASGARMPRRAASSTERAA